MDDLQNEVEIQRRVQQLSEVLRSTYEQLDELEEEVQELNSLLPLEPREDGQGGAGDGGEERGQHQPPPPPPPPEAPGSAQTLGIIVKKALRDTLQLSRHVALMRMRLLQHQLRTRSFQVAEVVANRLEKSPRADAASSSSEDETPEGADIGSVQSCTSTLSQGIRKRRSASVRFYRKSGVYSTTNTTSPEALSSPLTARRHRKVKFYLGDTRKYKHALSRLGRRTRLRYPSDDAITEGDPPSARTRSKLRRHLPSILRKTANFQIHEQSSRKTRASSRGADVSGGYSYLSTHYATEEIVQAPKLCYTTRKRSLDTLHSKKGSLRPEKSHKIARSRERAEAKNRPSRSKTAVRRQNTSGSQSDSALLTKRNYSLRRKVSEYTPSKHATQANRNRSSRVKKDTVPPSRSSCTIRAGCSETNQRKSDIKQSHNSTGDERFPLEDTNKFCTEKFTTASVIKLDTCDEAQDSGADDSKRMRGRVKEVGHSASSRPGRTFEKAMDDDSSRVRRHSAPAQTLGRGQHKAKCVESKQGFTCPQNEVDTNVDLGYRDNLKFKEVSQSSSKYSSGYLGDTENSPSLNTRSRTYRSSVPMITEEARLIDGTASSADNSTDDMDVQSSPPKTRRNRKSIFS